MEEFPIKELDFSEQSSKFEDAVSKINRPFSVDARSNWVREAGGGYCRNEAKIISRESFNKESKESIISLESRLKAGSGIKPYRRIEKRQRGKPLLISNSRTLKNALEYLDSDQPSKLIHNEDESKPCSSGDNEFEDVVSREQQFPSESKFIEMARKNFPAIRQGLLRRDKTKSGSVNFEEFYLGQMQSRVNLTRRQTRDYFAQLLKASSGDGLVPSVPGTELINIESFCENIHTKAVLKQELEKPKSSGIVGPPDAVTLRVAKRVYDTISDPRLSLRRTFESISPSSSDGWVAPSTLRQGLSLLGAHLSDYELKHILYYSHLVEPTLQSDQTNEVDVDAFVTAVGKVLHEHEIDSLKLKGELYKSSRSSNTTRSSVQFFQQPEEIVSQNSRLDKIRFSKLCVSVAERDASIKKLLNSGGNDFPRSIENLKSVLYDSGVFLSDGDVVTLQRAVRRRGESLTYEALIRTVEKGAGLTATTAAQESDGLLPFVRYPSRQSERFRKRTAGEKEARGFPPADTANLVNQDNHSEIVKPAGLPSFRVGKGYGSSEVYATTSGGTSHRPASAPATGRGGGRSSPPLPPPLLNDSTKSSGVPTNVSDMRSQSNSTLSANSKAKSASSEYSTTSTKHNMVHPPPRGVIQRTELAVPGQVICTTLRKYVSSIESCSDN